MIRSIPIRLLAAGSVACAVFCICLLSRPAPTSAILVGRTLTASQMVAAFGDACRCKKAFACTQTFPHGSSDCGYCDTNDNRVVCCETRDTSKSCDYTGSTNTCGNKTLFKVKPKDGSPSGSCNTCTVSGGSWTVDGNCDDMRDGVSAQQPCS